MVTAPISNSSNNFFNDVFDVVVLIPFGRVSTYGAIARYLGAARSSRMVGWAMNASHSEARSIPAHRVVNRQGMLTGKLHFLTPLTMQHLLEAEGVKVVEDRVINFNALFWDPSIELAL